MGKWRKGLVTWFSPGDIPALESHPAGVGLQYAGYQAQQSRLSRPIGTDQANDLIPANLEANPVDCSQTAEALGKLLNLEKRRCHPIPPLAPLSVPCAIPFPRLSSGAHP